MRSHEFVHVRYKENPEAAHYRLFMRKIHRWFPPQRSKVFPVLWVILFFCFQGKAGVRSRESQWYRWLNVHGTLDAERELIMYRWIGVLLYKTQISSIWNQLYKHADLPWHMTSRSQLHQAPPWWDDDVIKWKQFPRYWPFVRGIHRSRWIPHTKASAAELWCFLWSVSE